MRDCGALILGLCVLLGGKLAGLAWCWRDKRIGLVFLSEECGVLGMEKVGVER